MTERLRVLVNPSAGRGRPARELQRLRDWATGIAERFHLAADARELVAEARRAVAEGVQRLAVVGGDGTLHQVVPALADSNCALALVPGGTGNDLARALHVPSDPIAALELAAHGDTRRIDLGRVMGRPFLTVAGVGLHGEVARRAAERVRRIRGPAVYAWAVLRTVFSYDPPRFRVRYDGGFYDERAWMVAVANTPWFGGGMRIAPAARADDGRLDLVIVRAVSRSTLLRLFPRVYRGAHAGHPAVVEARTARVAIEVDRPQTLYGDGERMGGAGVGPFTLEAAPRGLLVVCGATDPRQGDRR